MDFKILGFPFNDDLPFLSENISVYVSIFKHN